MLDVLSDVANRVSLGLVIGGRGMACAHCKRDVPITLKSKGLCSACHSRLKRRGTVERAYEVRQPLCKVDGCEKKNFARNYCHEHYAATDHKLKEVWKGLRSRDKGLYPVAWDNFKSFVADIGDRPSTKHQLRRINPTQPWSKTNSKWLCAVPGGKRDTYTPERRAAYAKAWSLQNKFGLTSEDYAAKLKAQNGCCAICEQPETATNPHNGRPKELAVDHDHETGAVRGLLCVRCNRAIGYVDDSTDRLERAIAYLKFHRRPKLKLAANRDWIDVAS